MITPAEVNASEARPNALAIGFSCRAIAESLMHTRRRIAVIDCCGDLDTELCSDWVSKVDSLTDHESILEQVDALFDSFGILPVLLGSGTENVPELLKELERRWPDCLLKADWAGLRNWKNWQRWAKEAGFPFPVTFDRHTQDENNLFKFDEADSWLLKRTNTAGGLGIRRLDPIHIPDGLQISNLPENTLLQRRLQGRQLGVHFFSGESKTQVLGVVEGLPCEEHPSGDFVYRGSMGPVFLKAIEALLLENFANVVVRDTGLQGSWNADFLATDQGWHLIEINPRWGAGMEVLELCAPPIIVPEEAMREDFGASPGQSATSNQTDAPKFAMKRILYAAGDFCISQRQVQELVDRSAHGQGWNVDAFLLNPNTGLRVADIPVPNASFSPGMPLCTLLATADRREDAHRAVHAGILDLQNGVGLLCH